MSKSAAKRREIADSMNSNYREYISCLEAQRRVDDVRSVVAGQFSGIGDILSDLSDEFKSAMKCDTEAAERVISALSAVGIIPMECICLITSGEGMNVELSISPKRKRFSKGQFQCVKFQNAAAEDLICLLLPKRAAV